MKQRRVILRRAWSVYAGLVAALVAPIVLARYAPILCGNLMHCSGVCVVEINIVTLVAVLVGIALLHELVHAASARLMGVRGVRIRTAFHIGAIMMDYLWMTPLQYLIVAVAPQVLSVIILAVVRSGLVTGSLGLILCLGLIFNISGSMVDIVSAVYFSLAHWRANRFMLLYDDRGRVVGCVVEHDDKLVVYTIM